MVKLRLFRRAQHEPDAPAAEESQMARSKQQPQAQDVPVECGGAADIISIDRNLANFCDAYIFGWTSGSWTLSWDFHSDRLQSFYIVSIANNICSNANYIG